MTRYTHDSIKAKLISIKQFAERAMKDLDSFDYTDEEADEIFKKSLKAYDAVGDVGMALDKHDWMTIIENKKYNTNQ